MIEDAVMSLEGSKFKYTTTKIKMHFYNYELYTLLVNKFSTF